MSYFKALFYSNKKAISPHLSVSLPSLSPHASGAHGGHGERLRRAAMAATASGHGEWPRRAATTATAPTARAGACAYASGYCGERRPRRRLLRRAATSYGKTASSERRAAHGDSPDEDDAAAELTGVRRIFGQPDGVVS